MLESNSEKYIVKNPLTLYELLSLIISSLSLIISVVGLISIIFLVMQSRQAVASLESASWQAVQNHMLEVNKIFVEKPHLRPYFYSRADIEETDQSYHEVVAMAELKLDFFDSFWGQSKHLPELQENSHSWQAWEKYVYDSFANSPIMCRRLNEVRGWYTPEFREFASKGCSRALEPDISH